MSATYVEEAGNTLREFDVVEYLAEEHGKDLLRFSTAGSVDDGKSTLIGRLLYDTQSVYEDQIRSIEGKGTTQPGVLDLALLTDGLRAEREQGITIDVAYRYFATRRRKFIIADTPGHAQYTRNMATGASTADVAVVLVDARKGVLEQSRRHAYIATLLGVRHVIVAVNKMDLVGYEEGPFLAIRDEFTAFFKNLDIASRSAATLHFIPVSALAGDNVVHSTDSMPWYAGPSLLSLLQDVPAAHTSSEAFRFPVQRVIRPHLDFRGFAGQIAAGTIQQGDRVVALPSGQSSQVQRIVTYDGDLQQATAPLSVTLVLRDEIDISRGDVLVPAGQEAEVTSAFTASLVWMDAAPLELDRRYLLKHTTRTTPATIRSVRSTVDFEAFTEDASHTSLSMNGVGVVTVETSLPIVADTYAACRHTGSFILIDAQTNATVAAGMIRSTTLGNVTGTVALSTIQTPVSAAERAERWGHTGAVLTLHASRRIAEAVERSLFERGAFALLLERVEKPETLVKTGALIIHWNDREHEGTAEVSGHSVALPPDDIAEAAQKVLGVLELAGVLHKGAKL